MLEAAHNAASPRWAPFTLGGYGPAQRQRPHFAAQVSGLGSALLQALEKRDAEALAVLRGGHEAALLKVVRQVKEQAVKEAEENIVALGRDERSLNTGTTIIPTAST